MKAKKVMALALAAVMLIVTSVAATIAYLTDTEAVVNTFTVGNVYIDLDEKDVDNSTQDKDRDKSNKYHLIPGRTYTKDPTVTVEAGSEDCYLFVKVVNQIAALEDSANTIANQMEVNHWYSLGDNLWVYVGDNTDGKPDAVSANESIPVFGTLKISESVKNQTFDKLGPDATGAIDEAITITAYAIQSAGFESETASDIWTAANFS